MKLKVCGMKYVENIQQVAELNPDYLGFIFYEKSKRNFEGIIPEISKTIKKTGVFVNEDVDIVASLITAYNLQAVQLHGDETVEYIVKLKEVLREDELDSASQNKELRQAQSDNRIEIIKVFGIKDKFNFDILKPYLEVVDYFLFDTKGKERGGNGTKFDWKVLEKYPFEKPFFLSGGIGLEDVDIIMSFLRRQESKHCFGLDVNSKFESEPGLKNINEVKNFKNKLQDEK